MSTFGVKLVLEELGIRTPLYALTRGENCDYEEFTYEIKSEGTYVKELKSIYSVLEFLGSGRTPPSGKCRKLQGYDGQIQPWEIKTKNLRLYYYYDNGVIIICGGKKTNQHIAIKHLKQIVKSIPANVHQRRIT